MILGCTFSNKGDGADMLWALVQLNIETFLFIRSDYAAFVYVCLVKYILRLSSQQFLVIDIVS